MRKTGSFVSIKLPYKLWALFLVICLLAVGAFAQSFRGRILGTVTDPNGAAVPGATVTAKNLETGIERSTLTDSEGNFIVSELQIGIYEVRATATGLESDTIRGVLVEVVGDRRVEIPMHVKTGSENVVVA